MKKNLICTVAIIMLLVLTGCKNEIENSNKTTDPSTTPKLNKIINTEENIKSIIFDVLIVNYDSVQSNFQSSTVFIKFNKNTENNKRMYKIIEGMPISYTNNVHGTTNEIAGFKSWLPGGGMTYWIKYNKPNLEIWQEANDEPNSDQLNDPNWPEPSDEIIMKIPLNDIENVILGNINYY